MVQFGVRLGGGRTVEPNTRQNWAKSRDVRAARSRSIRTSVDLREFPGRTITLRHRKRSHRVCPMNASTDQYRRKIMREEQTRSFHVSRPEGNGKPDGNASPVSPESTVRPRPDSSFALHVQPSFEPVLDSEEAAALLRIHPKTLQKMARNGRVPGFRIGKLWAFRASVLNDWLKSKMAS
jgi:excisionase family DNA binding protein